MKIAIGADYYAGLDLKDVLTAFLKELGHEVVDCGAQRDTPVDYPLIAKKTARAVLDGCDRGILICGTGIGISIAANKVRGIRAAHCTDTYSARMAAEHNDANILALGERITGVEVCKEIVAVWLNSRFAGGGHQACLALIREIEDKAL